MKHRFRKIVSAFMGLIMVSELLPFQAMTGHAICCRKDGFDKSRYTLTGNMAEDVATIAKSQKGRTCDDFGYSGDDYGYWCDEYVADCLENAGADSSIVAHGGTVADFESILRKKGAVTVSSPKPGDLVFFTYSHVEIVTKVSNGVVYSAGGNNGNWPGECQGEHKVSSVRLYLRPNYPDKHYVYIYYNANGGTVSSDKYYAKDDGSIYRKNDNQLMGSSDPWPEGYRDQYGLVDWDTIELTRTGYEFVGWCRNADGSGTVWAMDDTSVSANDIFPEITERSGEVMLYAVWKKNKVAFEYNANGGIIADDSEYYADKNGLIHYKRDDHTNLNSVSSIIPQN